MFLCDYPRCPHKEAFRKDHCREHYREYHAEDIIKRGKPQPDKVKHRQKQPETLEQFLAPRLRNLDPNWWRCSKCLHRVQLNINSYTCPYCKVACEPERVTCRENARKSSNARAADSTTRFTSSPLNYMAGCGQCENTWLADKNDPRLWVACPNCRPGVKETTSF
jgi:hypothetical protein